MPLSFQPITNGDEAVLRGFYESCDFGLCDYSTGDKLMWRGEMDSVHAYSSGCLIIRRLKDKDRAFEYPVAGEGGDEAAALRDIERHCLENNEPLVFTAVPESRLPALAKRYPSMDVRSPRACQDYIYSAEGLRTYAGKRYAKRRNLAQRFHAEYPEAVFRPLTDSDDGLIDAFLERYEKEFAKSDSGAYAMRELAYSREMLKMRALPWVRAGGMSLQGELIGVELAEKCGDMLIHHIEKAYHCYVGIHPAMIRAFYSEFARDVELINREEDDGVRGLRIAKLQYEPVRLAAKYRVAPRCCAPALPREPMTLRTERLTLLSQPTEARFQVNLGEARIGEISLCAFDYTGGAEVRFDFSDEYRGAGLEQEACAALADWALYALGLYRVTGRAPLADSYATGVLDACMKRRSQHGEYAYYAREA